MKFFEHMKSQPFVLATGLAALIHSTWSLGTLFSGVQPAIEDISTWIQVIHFIGWLLPALLIAIALDVGQIVTSYEIRSYGLTWQRGLTFFVFGFATYYLQWLYIAHHMPALQLADGVSAIYRDFAVIMRDSGMWLIPALLPLSTLLYTFSGKQATMQKQKQIEITDYQDFEEMPFMPEENFHISECSACGWTSDEKTSAGKAAQALAAHTRHCAV